MFKWSIDYFGHKWNYRLKSFWWFLKILANWLNSHNYFRHFRVILLLNNCSIYKTSSIEMVLQSFSFITLLIHAYYLDFAPVEQWFTLIKRKLSEIRKRDNDRVKSNKTRQKCMTPWSQSNQIQSKEYSKDSTK